MIKKLVGLLLFAAGIAVIAAVVLRRDSFRSMTGWDSLPLRPRTEKTAPPKPEPPARPADNAPAAADSLAAPAADSCARIDPSGSIY